MLVVETIARIRREHFIKGKTIKEIARDLKVSRNTVRKVLRSGETSFEYERSVQPRPKLGRWAAELDGLLAGNAAKVVREQLTLIRIFEELRGRGYDGGYDAVRRYARQWSKERGQSTAAAYVPLSFAPGEAYQFDWSHEVVLLNGVTVIVKAAHVRLCHSRMLYVRCYPRETQEMVFDAHDRAFALFKGTCGRGIYDNMKTAVETIFVGKGRLYNRRFIQMCSHYLVDPVACTPASGWEKGQVENQVGLVRERFFTPRLRFKTLDELNVAAGQVHRLRQSAPASGVDRANGLGSVRSRAPQACSLRRSVRRIPRGAGIGLEDLLGALRQQQILGRGQRSRPPCRGSRLRRSHRDPPGRTYRRRASAFIRPWRDDLRSLALRAGAGSQTWRFA
jgi:transposase